MAFQVVGWQEIVKLKPEEPHLLIRAVSPKFRDADARFRPPPNDLCVATLAVEFDDVDWPTAEHKIIGEPEAQQIVDLVKSHCSEVSLIVCVCAMGRNRSAAIAAALSEVLNGESQIFFKQFRPTELAYRTILSVANKALR